MNHSSERSKIALFLLACLLVAPTIGFVVAADNGSRMNGGIAFTSLRDGNEEIYVMNADGSGQTRLTNNSEVDTDPSWSPDGTKIVFMSVRDGNEEIYVMNADGSGQTRLTNNSYDDDDPCWSPNGLRIAFASYRDGNEEIYVMNADGSGQTRLTNNIAEDDVASWSSDGIKIAFESDRDGDWEVYVMNTDGSSQTNLSNNSVADNNPEWSPDGAKISFDTDRDGNWEVYVMNADGSGQTRLTNNNDEAGFSVWSPDGTKIAFESDRDGNWQIYVMNADGSGQTNISNSNDDDWGPSWQSLWGYVNIYDLNVDGEIFTFVVLTNSTLGPIDASDITTAKNISFTVEGSQGTGMCDLTLPNSMLGGPYTVEVGGQSPWSSSTSVINATHTALYFTYNGTGTYTAQITGATAVPEFSLSMMILTFGILTLAVISLKRKFMFAQESAR